MNDGSLSEKAVEFFDALGEGDYPVFLELYTKALGLRLKIEKDRTRNPAISFTMGGELLMRFINDGKRSYIRLKYYSCENRGPVLEKALERTLEEHDFRYTGCYGCGKCAGKRRGYIVDYKNRKKYFRCGRELIEVFEVTQTSLPEIEDALTRQLECAATNRRAQEGRQER